MCITCCSVGPYGAVFLPGVRNINEATVYACRPGLRLWKANASGTVESTLLFRDHINDAFLNITLQRDVVLENSPVPSSEDRQFGCLLLYGSSCLVTFSGCGLYVIDRDLAVVVCYHCNLGPIIDVVVRGDEIYVLRKFSHRPVIRLSFRPIVDHSLVAKGKFFVFTSYSDFSRVFFFWQPPIVQIDNPC
jgi:hypothetical protein